MNARVGSGGGAEILLDAALTLIEENGVDALTMRSVAGHAGVSPGTVSYHFDTTEELIERALVHGTEIIVALLELVANDLLESDWDASDWPGIFARALAADLEIHRAQHLACLELHMLAARRPELRPAAEQTQIAYARVARTVVLAMGLPDPDQTVVGLVAMVTGLMFKEITTPAPGAEQRIREVLESTAATYSRDGR